MNHSVPRSAPTALALLDQDAELQAAARALTETGWWLGRGAVADELVAALFKELEDLREADQLEHAGIGREHNHQIDRAIRRDRIHWMSRQRPVQARFLNRMEALRLGLNRELFLGLFEFEGHFAHYPPGGFYRRHFDSFRGAANRIVSTVTYLNRQWQPGDGGELVIHPAEPGTEAIVIEPRAGDMVLFLSEEIEHEVLPARTDRTSIAGWFRLNNSLAGQVDPPR